jgi:hypothetical protein
MTDTPRAAAIAVAVTITASIPPAPPARLGSSIDLPAYAAHMAWTAAATAAWLYAAKLGLAERQAQSPPCDDDGLYISPDEALAMLEALPLAGVRAAAEEPEHVQWPLRRGWELSGARDPGQLGD